MSESVEVDTATEARPEPVVELWTFAGTRVSGSGKKVHAWLPPEATNPDGLLWFPPTKGVAPAVGAIYRVRAVRSGDRVTKYGDHSYVERNPDDGLRAALEVAHRCAQTELAAKRMEANDKRSSALDEVMAPRLDRARGVGPFEQAAVLVMVMRRINAVWGKRA